MQLFIQLLIILFYRPYSSNAWILWLITWLFIRHIVSPSLAPENQVWVVAWRKDSRPHITYTISMHRPAMFTLVGHTLLYVSQSQKILSGMLLIKDTVLQFGWNWTIWIPCFLCQDCSPVVTSMRLQVRLFWKWF